MRGFSAFQLLVAAVAAIAILSLALGFFRLGDEDISAQISDALAYAQGNEGILHEKEFTFPQGFAIRAQNFDSATRSVRFLCTNPETCDSEKAIVEPRLVNFTENYFTRAFFRCKKKDKISDCVVYFGNMPARLEATILSFPQTTQSQADVLFKVENTGSLDAVNIEYSATAYLLRNIGESIERSFAAKFAEQLERLPAGSSKTALGTLKIDAPGEYVLVVEAQGPEAGISRTEREFAVTSGISEECRATTKEREYLSGDLCVSELLCEGCSHGYECVQRWTEKGEQAELGSKDKAFSTTQSQGGACS
ncbi:MAG: hypothetical protein NUV67_02725 [archaeon]|nr:hypothetical protein [archaeon]